MKAYLVINLLVCSLLCFTTALTASQQIHIQVALPPNSGFDLGTLIASLPNQTTVEVRRESEAPAIVAQILHGKLDIAIVPTASLTSVAPSFAVFDLPFAVADGALDKLFTSVYSRVTTSYFAADLKQVGLGQIGGAMYGGTFVIRSHKPLRSPRDFRGTRIGLLQGTTTRQMFEMAGAQSLVLKDARSIVRAFENDEIDAAELPLQFIWPIMGREPSWVAMTKHRFSAHVVIYNQSNYARLPTNIRKRIEDALRSSWDPLPVLHGERTQSASTAMNLDENIRNEWRNIVGKIQWQMISKIDKALLSSLQRPTELHLVSFKQGPGADLSWNIWFQSGSQTFTKRLIKDREYNIVLDLGRSQYPGALSTQVEKIVLNEINRSPTGTDISLLIRPIIAGGNIIARPDQPLTAKILRIERRKLAAQDNDNLLLRRAEATKLPLQKISQALSVGPPLIWPIVAQRTGCVHIAFTIWNVSGLRPLDQLLVKIPVVAAGDSRVPDCSATISGGIDSLLSIDTVDGSMQADAALHFIDTGSKGEEDAKTVAVYVNRTELETALNDGQSPPVYVWTLANELSQFLGQPENLQQSIAKAHDEIEKPRPYESAVRQLSAAIFNARDRSEDAAANHAKASLKQLARQAEPPAIIVRYLDGNGSMQYLPLALLAADASDRILSQRLTLVQPLPRGQLSSQNSCIDNWDIAIPTNLEGAHAEAAELLARTDWHPTGPGTRWYRDNLELLNFLRERGNENPSGSGLLLLAHHFRGSITYSRDGNPDRILSNEVNREFGLGSVAVLAACSTSGTSVESRSFIKHLFNNGIDAVITSPFQVDTTFGTHFAINFAIVTKTAKKNGESAQLVDLFNRAVDLTMQTYQKQPGYRDMALEFQIIGNPQVRLCNNTAVEH